MSVLSIGTINDSETLENLIKEQRNKKEVYKNEQDGYINALRSLDVVSIIGAGIFVGALISLQAFATLGAFGITKSVIDVAAAIGAIIFGYFMILTGMNMYQESSLSRKIEESSKIIEKARDRLKEISGKILLI